MLIVCNFQKSLSGFRMPQETWVCLLGMAWGPESLSSHSSTVRTFSRQKRAKSGNSTCGATVRWLFMPKAEISLCWCIKPAMYYSKWHKCLYKYFWAFISKCIYKSFINKSLKLFNTWSQIFWSAFFNRGCHIFSFKESHKEFSPLGNGSDVFNRSDTKGLLPPFR